MKLLLIALALTMTGISGVSLSAQAAPQIEPGPAQVLNDQAIEAVDVLLKVNSKDLQTFRKSGNMMKEISVQMLEPGKARYFFTRQQCMVGGISGGICLGGAQLQVLVETVPGNMPVEKVTSQVLFLR